MSNLNGIRILFCREQKRSAAFESALTAAGAVVQFMPVFRSETTIDTPEIRTLLQRIVRHEFAGLIFSSVRGIDAFGEALAHFGIENFTLEALRVSVVGEKTARHLQSVFPGSATAVVADNLQELLDRLAEISGGNALAIAHPTSEQSLANIHPQEPENVNLLRVPFYRTVAAEGNFDEILTDVGKGLFDVIVFSSPSSFDCFMEIAGDEALLSKVAIAVFGDTTRTHIEGKGFPVAIVPDSPAAGALLRAIVAHFQKKQAFAGAGIDH